MVETQDNAEYIGAPLRFAAQYCGRLGMRQVQVIWLSKCRRFGSEQISDLMGLEFMQGKDDYCNMTAEALSVRFKHPTCDFIEVGAGVDIQRCASAQ